MRLLRSLPRNGCTVLLVAYLLRACLPSPYLATGRHITIYLADIFIVVLYGVYEQFQNVHDLPLLRDSAKIFEKLTLRHCS
jgi:hypothetical protein